MADGNPPKNKKKNEKQKMKKKTHNNILYIILFFLCLKALTELTLAASERPKLWFRLLYTSSQNISSVPWMFH